MATRWSLPSGGVGVHRWETWPLGADSYDHAELTANWDKLDGIVGGPAGGTTWPPTEGLDGGIYFQMQLLMLERAPIGMTTHWFRPSTAVALTTITNYGWVVMDGSTLAPSDHSFPGVAGSVTLPNLLNATIVGADSAKAVGAAGVAATDGNINTAAGAPGIAGIGGFNGVALTIAQLPAHDHGGGDHTHTYNRQVITFTTGGLAYLANVRDAITHTETTNASGTIIQSQGGSANVDNRQRYVGLLPICKVKHVSSLS